MNDIESRIAAQRPYFYLVRPEPCKKFVPLIPIDELPSFLRLEGVPLSLDANMIKDWSMARVGDTTPRLGEYGIQISMEDFRNYHPSTDIFDHNNSAAQQERTEPDTLNAGCLTTSIAVGSSGNRVYVPISTVKDQVQASMGEVAEKAKWEKENDPSKTKDAMTPGVFGKKKYCTHWIRTGNCDYVQEGCKYLHVIPDEDTRMQIGIRDMPRWAKEDLPPPPGEPSKGRGRWTAAANKSWRRPNRTPVPGVVTNQSPSFQTGSSKPPTPSTPTSQGPKITQDQNDPSKMEMFRGPIDITPSNLNGLTKEVSGPFMNHSHAIDKQPRRDSMASTNTSFKRHLLTNPMPLQHSSPNGFTYTQPKIAEPEGSSNYQHYTNQTLTMNSRPMEEHNTQPPNPSLNAASAPDLGKSSPPRQTSDVSPGRDQPQNMHFAKEAPLPNLTPLPDYIDQHTNRQHVLQQYNNSSAAEPLNWSTTARHHPSSIKPDLPTQLSAGELASLFRNSQNSTTQNGNHHVGIIGQGRPPTTFDPQTQLHPPKPTTSFPVHRRMFVNPGEDKYIIAQPEPPEKPKGNGGKASKKHKGPKGRGRNAYESENLINFDADQSTDG